MIRHGLLLSAALFVSACSSSPEKKDDVVSEPVQVETVPSASDLMKDVEAVPSADSLGEPQPSVSSDAPKVVSQDTTKVEAGVAAMISDAVAAAEKGDLTGAASELESLIDDPTGGFLAAYNLGVVNERQGAYEKAAKRYFQSLQLNADFSPALINLARLYLRQNRPSDAERLVQKFSDQRPDNLGHRAAALEVLLFKGAYEDVINKAKDILRKDERNVDAMYALAQANFALGRFELARSVIERAVDLTDQRADLYNLYGSIELKLNNKAGAIANYRKAVEIRPQYPEARNNLGVLYHDARDYESAAAQFEEAIRVFPDFKEAFLNLGNSYKGLKRYKDAELAFKRAIEIDPNFGDGQFNLAILYLDSDVPGMEPIARLQKSIDLFNQYKSIAKQRAKDDPADKYIEEARKTIEVEKQKAEMMRESQMNSEEPPAQE